jgi:hypothetical protein
VTGESPGQTTIFALASGLSATVPTTVTTPSTPPPPPPPPGGSASVIFASDFGAATGTGNNATSDGGTWTIGGSSGGLGNIEVVNAASAGIVWPSQNALLVGSTGTTNGRFPYGDFFNVPSVGQSLFYRWYLRVVAPDDLPSQTLHPIQNEPSVSATTWQSQIFTSPSDPDGFWDFRFNFKPGNEFYGVDDWLPKDTTMRVELQITRTGSSTANYHARIYYLQADGSEILMYGDDDFLEGANLDPGSRGPRSLSDRPSIGTANVDNLNGLTVGVNGFDNAPYPFVHHYQGAFAVCLNNWCGPYTPGEAN